MIRIALYRGRSVVSRLIRWQTRSVYSHAALLLPDGSVIEAWTDGVCLAAPGDAHCEGTPVDVFSVRTENELASRIAERSAMSQLGKGYDFRSVLRFVSRARQSRYDQERWFCSELVFWAFECAGIHLLGRTAAWEVSPGLLARSPLLVQEHGAGFATSKGTKGNTGTQGSLVGDCGSRAPGALRGAPGAERKGLRYRDSARDRETAR